MAGKKVISHEEKDPNPGVQGQAGELAAAKNYTPDYQWAVNVVKLNRAKAYVRQQAIASGEEKKGKDLEEAVKARYMEIKGLLKEDEPNRLAKGKKAGRIVNVAENDGSED